MPVVNRLAALADEITEWRRDLHAHPEIMYELPRTAATVAEKLKSFGCDEVVPGLGPHRRRRRHPRQEAWQRQGGGAPRRHGRAADRGGDRALLRLANAGQDARLRPRRPHGHAARRRQASLREPQLRRHGGDDLPAGRGRRRRRQGHDRRRAAGTLLDRRGLRPAQLPRHSRRPVRHPAGCDHGRRRPAAYRGGRRRRPRRAPASRRRHGARRRPRS